MALDRSGWTGFKPFACPRRDSERFQHDFSESGWGAYRGVMRGGSSSRGIRCLPPLVLAVGLIGGVLACPVASARAAGTVALPDMRIIVPTTLISIGIDPNTGHRELRFTHETADVGAGPFEIDPHYNALTGVSTFTQAIYRSNGPGRWSFDRSVPLAADGVWHPPSDYAFPLTHFALDKYVNNTIGATVATSPKTDYCITGDTQLSGVPNSPNQTFIPVSDCGDPTAPLGWSVGWADEYDQTDAGQPIDLTGVPNGTYILRATVDPYHVLTESNRSNDETDTVLDISGNNVTVVRQWVRHLVLPSAHISTPPAGSAVSGMVELHATAKAASGSAISAAQFILDGQPLGPVMRKAPFNYLWDTSGIAKGHHYLSFRVTDKDGTISSAKPSLVDVIRAPSLTVSSGSWRAGVLSLRLSGAPKGAKLLARLSTAKGMKSAHFRSSALRVETPRPSRIRIEMSVAGKPYVRVLAFGLGDRPTASISAPAPHTTLSGIVALSAVADDVIGVTSVSFAVDGRLVGHRLSRRPYAIRLDTRKLHGGSHRLTVTARNGLGRSTSVSREIVVRNPAPTMTCYVMQATREAFGSGVASTTGFRTVVNGETLLAFVSSDGPATGRQTATVSGGGLTWHLDARADGSAGDSEIWSAMAYKAGSIGPITARLSARSYNVSLSVVAEEGADGVGATASRSGSTGAPSLRLKTLSGTSLVFAVGNDWDQAIARKLPAGWQMLYQRLDTSTGDTFWVQYTNQPTGKAGSVVTVKDLAPTTDRWNLAAVEVINDGG